MNIKINTICFILLLFLLISAVNAADSDNETFQSPNQPDPNQDIDNVEKIQMNIILIHHYLMMEMGLKKILIII